VEEHNTVSHPQPIQCLVCGHIVSRTLSNVFAGRSKHCPQCLLAGRTHKPHPMHRTNTTPNILSQVDLSREIEYTHEKSLTLTTQNKKRKKHRWSVEDNYFLGRHYEIQGARWCAQQLGIPIPRVRTQAYALHIPTGVTKYGVNEVNQLDSLLVGFKALGLDEYMCLTCGDIRVYDKYKLWKKNPTQCSKCDKKFGRVNLCYTTHNQITFLYPDTQPDKDRITYRCRCSCGNIMRHVIPRDVFRNDTKSCGHCTDSIAIGDTSGILVVIDTKKAKRGQQAKVQCKCGKQFWLPASVIKTGMCVSCGTCNYGSSRGHIRILQALKCLNINFIEEHPFDGCIYKGQLNVDFYLVDLNIAIEFHGEQHYKPIDKWGGIEKLHDQQIRDQIKRDYCATNGITLYEIPYTYFDDLEGIIIDLVNGNPRELVHPPIQGELQ